MEKFKSLFNKQVELIEDIKYTILSELDNFDNKIINFSEVGFPIGFEWDYSTENYIEVEVVAIGKFDDILCIITQPVSTTHKIVWKDEQLPDSDEWRSLENGDFSTYATVVNICEVLSFI